MFLMMVAGWEEDVPPSAICNKDVVDSNASEHIFMAAIKFINTVFVPLSPHSLHTLSLHSLSRPTLSHFTVCPGCRGGGEGWGRRGGGHKPMCYRCDV